MPISTLNRRAGPYAGNGATTAFAFAFKVTASTDVLVILADSAGAETVQDFMTHYTVLLNADQDAAPGGTVTMLTPPPSGVSLFIGSRAPPIQLADLNNAGGFYPRVVTEALDRLTILAQQTVEQISRAALSPYSEGPNNLVWPRVSARANRLLAFDGAGRMVLGPVASAVAASLANITPTGLPGQNVAQTFAGMAALAKDTLADGVTVVCVGGVTRGDGLGGVFWWDEASTDPDDGMNVIESFEGGDGRWRRAAFAGGNVFVDFYVTNLATIYDLSVSTDIRVSGVVDATGDLLGGRDALISRDGSFGRNLQVIGASTLAATNTTTLTASGMATLSAGLNVTGEAVITGAARTPSTATNATATTTLDCRASNVFRVAMGTNITTLTLSNPGDGQTVNIRFVQDGTGGRTVTWPASFRWAGASAPTLSTAADRVDLLVASYFADTGTWLASLAKNFG
jgi:hypothetical protein